MPIQVQCASCDRQFKVKEEFAGRRVKCPGCQSGVSVPSSESVEDEDLFGDAAEPVKKPRTKSKSKSRGAVSGKSSPWYQQHWQWLVVAGVLLLAIWPTVGIFIAGFVALIGMLIALVCGLIPFFRILFGAPGTVLMMIVSRSARFEMMEQPDSHPYKVLVRTAFNPTRGLFWRGVLLIVAFIPAAFIHGAASEFFRKMKNNANPGPVPVFGPGFAPGPGPGNAGGPLFQPGRPGMPEAARNPAEQGRTFYVRLIYKDHKGAGSATESAQALVAELPGARADTVKVDEESKTIRFEHQGPLSPPTLFPLFSKHGFNGMSYQSSTKPE